MNIKLLAARNLTLHLLLFYCLVCLFVFIKRFPTWKKASKAPEEPLPPDGEAMAERYSKGSRHMGFYHLCEWKSTKDTPYFQARVTQEDTVVHSRTWGPFIWKVGRWWWWEGLKRNLKILTPHHLHNWVRKEVHVHVAWEERGRLS